MRGNAPKEHATDTLQTIAQHLNMQQVSRLALDWQWSIAWLIVFALNQRKRCVFARDVGAMNPASRWRALPTWVRPTCWRRGYPLAEKAGRWPTVEQHGTCLLRNHLPYRPCVWIGPLFNRRLDTPTAQHLFSLDGY